jgi:hypothetical protein
MAGAPGLAANAGLGAACRGRAGARQSRPSGLAPLAMWLASTGLPLRWLQGRRVSMGRLRVMLLVTGIVLASIGLMADRSAHTLLAALGWSMLLVAASLPVQALCRAAPTRPPAPLVPATAGSLPRTAAAAAPNARRPNERKAGVERWRELMRASSGGFGCWSHPVRLRQAGCSFRAWLQLSGQSWDRVRCACYPRGAALLHARMWTRRANGPWANRCSMAPAAQAAAQQPSSMAHAAAVPPGPQRSHSAVAATITA